MSKWLRWPQWVSHHTTHIANVIYFLSTRLISIMAFMVSVPFFIRQTSDTQYGLVAIGFSLLGLNTVLDVAIGYVLTQSLGRRIARSRPLNIRLINGLFSVYLTLAIGLSILSMFGALISDVSLSEKIFYVSLALLLPALATSGIVAAIFQAQNALKPINLSRFSFEIGKAFSLIGSAVLAHSILWIGPLLCLVGYARAIADYWYLKRKAGISMHWAKPKHAARFWRVAQHGTAPLLTVLLTLLVTVSDKILIKRFFSAEDVAHYSIAFDINTKAYLLVNAVNTAMFAVLLHRFARRSSTQGPIQVGLLAVLGVAIFYYIPLCLWSESILGLWVNKTFAMRAARLTSIMSVASLFYLLGNVFENALNAMGQARKVMQIYAISITAYFLTLAGLGPIYGVTGFMYSYTLLCILLSIGFVYRYFFAQQRILVAKA